MKCCVCNREREAAKTLILTEEEKEHILRLTLTKAPDSYSYCAACWAVTSNRQQGAQLFKGLMRAGLARAGVRQADQLADRYYRFLLEHSAKKPVS
jgi:hypothetical protein